MPSLRSCARLLQTGPVTYALLSSHETNPIEPSWLVLLALFVDPSTPDAAHERLRAAAARAASGAPPKGPEWDFFTVQIGMGKVELHHPEGEIIDAASARAADDVGFIAALCRADVGAVIAELAESRSRFDEVLAAVSDAGIVAPASGTLDWGSLRRLRPLCRDFGVTRGEPVDRFYERKFVAEVAPKVSGATIEIGGRKGNAERYGFRSTSYRAVDVAERGDVDVIGDVHDPGLFEPASLDSVVSFFVLEHCVNPWVVVENARTWLKPGGFAAFLAPCVQRVHGEPDDFWRILPSAFEWMFRAYAQRQIRVYGNPVTSVAAHMGIAAEELTPAELEFFDPEYPVAAGMIATK